MKKKTAFTLAEVLIALVIIGVIAAMTIPTLLNNTNAIEYRTALKKSIAVLNQAITMQYALEGSTVSDYATAADLSAMFQRRLNVVGTTAGAGFKGTDSEASIYTADGIMYSFKLVNNPCSSTVPCYVVYIDVNGDKKPNKQTAVNTDPKDGYTATLYPQRAVPGSSSDTITQTIMYDTGL